MASNPLVKILYSFDRAVIFSMLAKALARRKQAYEPGKTLLYVAATCQPYHASGYTERTRGILNALREKDASFAVVTRPGYPWGRKDRLRSPTGESTLHEGIAYQHVRRPGMWRLLAYYAWMGAKGIMEAARKNGAARIHAASNHTNALPALLAARWLGIPFQYEIRGLWEMTRATRVSGFENSPPYNLGLELEGYVARNADKLFVISRQVGDFASANWGIPKNRIRPLPNCVNGVTFPIGLVEDDLLGFAGSIMGYEGLDTLLGALAILRDKGQRPRLHIMGDGEARKDLEKMANELGLGEQVTFFGRLPHNETLKQLARCAIVCLPRTNAKVCELVPPLKLVEALSMGKPVIASDLPVLRDELAELGGGMHFKAQDPGSLASTITKALASPANLAALGEKGRDLVSRKRLWAQHAPAILPEGQCWAH